MSSWTTLLRTLTSGLILENSYARGAERIAAATETVHTARVALECMDGDDVQVVREFLAAIEAAHKPLGGEP